MQELEQQPEELLFNRVSDNMLKVTESVRSGDRRIRTILALHQVTELCKNERPASPPGEAMAEKQKT